MEHFFEFNVVSVLQIIILIMTIGGAVWAVRSTLDRITMSVEAATSRLTAVEEEMKVMTTVLVSIGKQEERINALDQRLMMTGQRFDDFSARFNKFLDDK